jgi:uncharacterized protein (TIGR03083 family)
MMTKTVIDQVAPIERPEATVLAAGESGRMVDLLRSLDAADWTKPTDCPAWDVRDVAGHVLGMTETFSSLRQFAHDMRAGGKAAKAAGGPFIDGLTGLQVATNAALTQAQLLERLADAGPRQARWRARRHLMRHMPMKQEIGGVTETWRMGYLVDVILTRDTWMHRIDIARATGRQLVLTPEHDGRIVADVVAEWARRHGKPFMLHLGGPAGGTYAQGEGGEEITIDAIEFCRTLAGRAIGTGLLTQQVPF